MNCARCDKKLSRKTARSVGGEILCSPCLFGPPPELSEEERARRLLGHSTTGPLP